MSVIRSVMQRRIRATIEWLDNYSSLHDEVAVEVRATFLLSYGRHKPHAFRAVVVPIPTREARQLYVAKQKSPFKLEETFPLRPMRDVFEYARDSTPTPG
jgi:hypothetical protein